MVNIEYFNGEEWVKAGGPFGNEKIAWISLGGDNLDYRTVNADTGEVLTDPDHETKGMISKNF